MKRATVRHEQAVDSKLLSLLFEICLSLRSEDFKDTMTEKGRRRYCWIQCLDCTNITTWTVYCLAGYRLRTTHRNLIFYSCCSTSEADPWMIENLPSLSLATAYLTEARSGWFFFYGTVDSGDVPIHFDESTFHLTLSWLIIFFGRLIFHLSRFSPSHPQSSINFHQFASFILKQKSAIGLRPHLFPENTLHLRWYPKMAEKKGNGVAYLLI